MKKRYVALLLPLFYLVAIPLYGIVQRAEPSAVAVVLGNKVHPDGTLSKRLEARLACALAIYRKNRCATVIVSGGTGVEGINEAVAMRDYLLAKGIPNSALVVDSLGVTTEATARFAANYCNERGLSCAIAVSQHFHLARCAIAFRKAGIAGVSTEAPRFFELRDIYSTLREAPALPVYLFKRI